MNTLLAFFLGLVIAVVGCIVVDMLATKRELGAWQFPLWVQMASDWVVARIKKAVSK